MPLTSFSKLTWFISFFGIYFFSVKVMKLFLMRRWKENLILQKADPLKDYVTRFL